LVKIARSVLRCLVFTSDMLAKNAINCKQFVQAPGPGFGAV
jgi:hypothetical protein